MQSNDIGNSNVERLLGTSYKPAMPDPEFVKSVGALLQAEARALQTLRPREADDQKRLRKVRWRLGWAMTAAACAAGVALLLHAFDRPEPAKSVYDGQVQGFKTAKATSWSGQAGPGLKPRPLSPQPEDVKIAVGAELETKAGQRRRATLADGSVVFLNAGTKVKYVAERVVKLEQGELYIEVSPRPAGSTGATFLVKAPDRDVQALGTHFSVWADGLQSGVAVTQGKVQVSGLANLVHAGQQLTPGANAPATAPPANHMLDWMRDLMIAAESPLVPCSTHAGGALIVVDPNGQEMRLSMRKYHVDVFIEDGFARTTIDQTYFNETWSRLEGTFYFPLPPDATLSRLAMYVKEGVNCKLMEGGMAERDHARDVYETILHARRDPALLEWVDGSTFKMRVFPLEPREEKRLLLSYTQKLPGLFGTMQYRFPAGHSLEAVGEWSFEARVRNGSASGLRCFSPSHPLMNSKADGADMVLSVREKNAMLKQDVVLRIVDEGKDANGEPRARISSFLQEDAQYLMLRYRPKLTGQVKRERRDWVFLYEASASRDPLVARAQIEVIRGLLQNAEHNDTFTLVAANTRVHPFDSSPAAMTEDNIKAAVRFLEGVQLIGAMDLGQALNAVEPTLKQAANPWLVHVGSGIATMGLRNDAGLVTMIPSGTQYVGVGVGKQWGRAFMKLAADRTGGYFTQINPDEPINWRAFELLATLNTPRLLDVRVADGGAGGISFLADVTTLAQGEEIWAVARIDFAKKDPMPKTLVVRGKVGGMEVVEEVKVEYLIHGAGYLPRQWAKLELDRLLAEDQEKNKQRIIELSKQSYVMTPFTSLLVLETEEDYVKFKVDRGRKDHWAMYQCPEKIPVVYEPNGGPAQGGKDQVDQETVLASILVRTVPRMVKYESEPQWWNWPAAANVRDLNAWAYAVHLTPEFLNENEIRLGRRGGDDALRLKFAVGAAQDLELLRVQVPAGQMGTGELGKRFLGEKAFAGGGIDGGGRGFGGGIGGLGQLGAKVVIIQHVDRNPVFQDHAAMGVIKTKDLWGGFGGQSGQGGFGGARFPQAKDMGGDFRNRPASWPFVFDAQINSMRFNRISDANQLGAYDPSEWMLASDSKSRWKVFDDDIMIALPFRSPWGSSLDLNKLTAQPNFTGDQRIFDDLLWYAPGMNTNPADIQAVLEAEVKPAPASKLGNIDPAARKLIDRARAFGWRKIAIPAYGRQSAFDLNFDGHGRFQFERVLANGLREQVVCDGQMLWHLYPEIGLGAKRFVSRFHRAALEYEVPWMVPSADDFAHDVDVVLVDKGIVGLIPRGHDKAKDDQGKPLPYVQINLFFSEIEGEDGRLVERQLVAMPQKTVLEIQRYGPDGTITVIDPATHKVVAEVKLPVTPAKAPDLAPDMNELVVIAMPLRSIPTGFGRFGNLATDIAKLDADQAINRLAVACATPNLALASQIHAHHFHDKGDKRVGFGVLLASTGGWIGVLEDRPRSPLAAYLASRFDGTDLSKIGGPPDGFIQRLARFRELWNSWSKGNASTGDEKARERTIQFLGKSPLPIFDWALLTALSRKDNKANVDLMDACKAFADDAGFSFAARYEVALGLFKSDIKSHRAAGQKLFTKLYLDTIDAGVMPPLDQNIRTALMAAEAGQPTYADVLRRAASNLAKRGLRLELFTLPYQTAELGDKELANDLAIQALAACERTGDRTLARLAAVQFYRHTQQPVQGDAMLQQLLPHEPFKESPAAWRLAAEFATQRNLPARAADCLEKAFDLELRDAAMVVNLQTVRSDYELLLTQYQQMANALVALEKAPPREFVAKVISAADRWRALDPEPAQPCQMAGKILQTIGAPELAWDYLTTPIGMKPNQTEPWWDLARWLRAARNVDLADRAYVQAAQMEPTNAQILWDRAAMLMEAGRTSRAFRVYETLADGDWQPRFQWMKTEATERLKR